MLLLRLPGASCPDEDTAMLLDCLLEEDLPPEAAVLDLGTEPGLMAELLERAGADVTRTMDLRTRRGRARLHGSWWAGRRESFDLIVANVPFLAGSDLVTRICRDAPRLLADRGVLWLVHSALLDPQVTIYRLGEACLNAKVMERREVAFGPAMWSRAAALRAEGLIAADQCTEDLVVIRAAMAVIAPDDEPAEPVARPKESAAATR